MARPISDEELQLKKRARRRLVGAIVLVTAVAVVLPMVLDSEPRPVSQNVEIQIPSPDSGEFKPKAAATAPNTPAAASTVPMKGMPPGSAAPSAASKDSPAKAAASGEPAKAAAVSDPAEDSAGAPDGPKEPATAAAKEPAKAGAKSGAGGYVIQLEALADPSRAKRLQEKVAGTGLKSYTEVVATKTGELTRVRAGPYPTREAAEKARTQLKKAGLDGKVVPK